MEAKLAVSGRFFKVMIPGFEDKLNLPPAFCKRLKQEKSEWAIVKSCIGTWKINVCTNREGLFCFKDGWPNFVHHHGLTIGDFVLFEHTGGMHFNAAIFDLTACEKEFSVEERKKGHEETTEVVNSKYRLNNTKREADNESGGSYHSDNPCFTLIMTPSHAYRCGQATIPANFFRSNNLDNVSSVTLRGPRGKAWTVELKIQKIGHLRCRCRMGKGWHEFYVSNELKDGDACVFYLSRRSLQSSKVLMDVRICRAPF